MPFDQSCQFTAESSPCHVSFKQSFCPFLKCHWEGWETCSATPGAFKTFLLNGAGKMPHSLLSWGIVHLQIKIREEEGFNYFLLAITWTFTESECTRFLALE